MLAFTTGQVGAKRGLTRWTTKYQAFLFFPLLLLEGASLHWSSVEAVWRRRTRRRRLEKTLLVTHTVAYLAAVFLVLSPWKALVFIAVHQGLWGLYMGCSFAPNHKGMPASTDEEGWDFLRKQVLTSRNVSGGRWVDAVLGGLNYQIEHHLFPSMPRPNLRRARPMVQAFCVARGIPYHESGLLRSYRDVLEHLHAVVHRCALRDGEAASLDEAATTAVGLSCRPLGLRWFSFAGRPRRPPAGAGRMVRHHPDQPGHDGDDQCTPQRPGDHQERGEQSRRHERDARSPPVRTPRHAGLAGLEGVGEAGVLGEELSLDLTQSLPLMITEHDPPPRDDLPARERFEPRAGRAQVKV
ncbi:hypothetical protein BJF90_00620 [Pseudonocardia sp. CNS-004]|nr:hypothetical protein BJF90_00620 [Pseudonocardia sp. CNS-004]